MEDIFWATAMVILSVICLVVVLIITDAPTIFHALLYALKTTVLGEWRNDLSPFSAMSPFLPFFWQLHAF
jgi:hypothetical protein